MKHKATLIQSVRTTAAAATRHPLWRKALARLPASWTTRTGSAVLAAGIIVIASSVAVATIALWPTPDVQRTTRQELPSGNHIVGYDAKNCDYFSSMDGQPPREQRHKLYYEVREDVDLTDEQLQNSLRAICEESLSDNAIKGVMKRIPADLPGVESTMTYTVDAITSSGLTITLDPHYNASAFTTKPGMTYNQFSRDLLVYNQSSKASLADIGAGDSIKMIIQSTSERPTETAEQYNPLNYPASVVILAIIKVPPLTADPTVFHTAVGSDLVRLEACNNSPTGFCRVYDFAD